MDNRLRAPLGFCATKGCPNRARGHCPDHAQERQRTAQATRAPSDARLHTQRWRVYSQRRLQQSPWCVGYPVGVHGRFGKLAECTDHIKGTRKFPELFWDPTNHQSLCMDCNRKKAIAEEGGFG